MKSEIVSAIHLFYAFNGEGTVVKSSNSLDPNPSHWTGLEKTSLRVFDADTMAACYAVVESHALGTLNRTRYYFGVLNQHDKVAVIVPLYHYGLLTKSVRRFTTFTGLRNRISLESHDWGVGDVTDLGSNPGPVGNGSRRK